MHLYLSSIGFKSITSQAKERKLLRQVIHNAVTADDFVVDGDSDVATIRAHFSENFGLCLKGSVKQHKNGTPTFNMEYYFPFVVSNHSIDVEDITIERHADKDSYAVICDEIKPGVTLIFYLQNIADYYKYIADFDHTNHLTPSSVTLSGLASGGLILLPIDKTEKQILKVKEERHQRNDMIKAARNGDEEAIESLTIDDLDIYSQISSRLSNEDIYSIVDTTFMPYGVECDQYSVIGEILSLAVRTNSYTKETVYEMVLDCNDIILTACVNSENVYGEPAVGRRFKGNLWISAHVNF